MLTNIPRTQHITVGCNQFFDIFWIEAWIFWKINHLNSLKFPLTREADTKNKLCDFTKKMNDKIDKNTNFAKLLSTNYKIL